MDSVPVTAMMIKVVAALAQNEKLALPVQPLVWALAFGPTMGGRFKKGRSIAWIRLAQVTLGLFIIEILSETRISYVYVGNGTLYGASANIVCAGVAEKLGHKITFFQYFKYDFYFNCLPDFQFK